MKNTKDYNEGYDARMAFFRLDTEPGENCVNSMRTLTNDYAQGWLHANEDLATTAKWAEEAYARLSARGEL